MKPILCAPLAVLLWGAACGMTLEEAGRNLGSDDEAVAREAEQVLVREGWEAIGILERHIFSDNKHASERATRCRRWIQFGVHHGIPEDLRNELLDYPKLAEERQRELIDALAKEPAVGPVTLACLHSRVAEASLSDEALAIIEAGYRRKQSDAPAGFPDHDPKLLVVPTRALVANVIASIADSRTTSAGVSSIPRWRSTWTQQGSRGNSPDCAAPTR